MKLSAGAGNYEETLPALRYAFNQLGDKHGWLIVNDKEYRNEALQPKENRVSPNMAEAASKGARIYCGVVDNRYDFFATDKKISALWILEKSTYSLYLMCKLIYR